MSSAQPPTAAHDGEPVEHLRSMMTAATQRLLGDTIEVTNDQWRADSRLPGWSRGHVATHLARQADALVRLLEGARTGIARPMYGSAGQREAEIEAGAFRSGLELQIDLDTSADALSQALEAVAHQAAAQPAGTEPSAWESVVELRGGDQAPLRLLPLARLAEVVLHHVDLDIGLDMSDVDEDTADALLEWLAFRLQRRENFPRVRVRAQSGLSLLVGGQLHEGQEAPEVSGGSAHLLGWLTGRSSSSALTGTEGIELAAF